MPRTHMHAHSSLRVNGRAWRVTTYIQLDKANAIRCRLFDGLDNESWHNVVSEFTRMKQIRNNVAHLPKLVEHYQRCGAQYRAFLSSVSCCCCCMRQQSHCIVTRARSSAHITAQAFDPAHAGRASDYCSAVSWNVTARNLAMWQIEMRLAGVHVVMSQRPVCVHAFQPRSGPPNSIISTMRMVSASALASQ